MYLIQLLVPLFDNNEQKFPAEYFRETRNELAEHFGGVTAFFRSPAVGLWKESDKDLHRDEVVLFEVMASDLNEDWWREYRLGLQQKFRQEEMMIWASAVTKL